MPSGQFNLLLGNCYAAELLGKGNYAAAQKALKAQLTKGSAMEKEARELIPQLEKVKERCFISRKHLEYIQHGLVQ